MAPVPLLFLCLCLISRINCEVQSENSANTYQTKDNDVNAVLNYLNSYSFKLYNYKEATLLSAHTKADISELVLEINVDCINKYPDLPCSEKILTCHAFVRNTPEGGSQILNDVNCKPRPTIIVEEPSPSNPSEAEITDSKSTSLSNEAVSSEVVEPFVAVKKNAIPCLGCPFDLNPNADGVDELVDLALHHVESERQNKHALIKILKLQQQVVSGIKYILVAELAPTTCQKNSYDLSACPIDGTSGTYVCEITYLQKPWISKAKHIIGNNCTVSQEFVKSKNEISNEIDGKHVAPGTTPDFDHIAENGGAEQMSPSRLSELESQIIVDEVQPIQSTKSAEEVVPSVVPLPEVTDSLQIEETEPQVAPSNEPTATNQEYYESTPEMATETTVQEDSRIYFEQKSRKKRAIPQLEKITHEERPLVMNLADFAADALDNIDDDNHKRIILQILGAKKMVSDDGVYYHLILRMGVSRCLEDKPNLFKNCREKLIENYTKICKVQIFCYDDFGSPKIVKSQCQNIKRDKNDNNKTNYGRYRRQLAGGQTGIDKNSEKVKKLLNEGITHLNAKWDKNNKYKPIEVLSATSQVVAGSLTRIQTKIAETKCAKTDDKNLEDCEVTEGATPKKCEVKVWEKPWEHFKQYTVECEGEQKYTTEVKTDRKKREVAPGGEYQVPKDDTFVEKYLEYALTKLDEKSEHENKYKVEEIISSTSQVVSGHIYRIRAKIALSECKKTATDKRNDCNTLQGAESKICDFVVFDKTWVANSRETNVTCGTEVHSFRQKRETERVALGGESQASEDDESVKKYLEASLAKLDQESSDKNKVKLHEFLSATKQVVAGHVYKIKVKIVQSDCEKNSNKERHLCGVLEGAEPKTCRFEVFEGLNNDRKIDIDCGSRKKRQVSRENDIRVFGGESDIDKNSDKVKQLLNEGITHLNAKWDKNNKYKPIEVLSATSQVVAGSLTRIQTKIAETKCAKTDDKNLEDCEVTEGATPKKCEVKVWEKPWENFKQYTVECEGEQKYTTEVKTDRKKREVHSFKRKRDIMSFGGESQASEDDESVKKYLEASLTKLDQESSDKNKAKVHEFLSATKQVVAGFVYRIKAKIVQSDCEKNSNKERHLCGVLEGAEPKTCRFEVLEGLNNNRKIDIDCDSRKKRQSSTHNEIKLKGGQTDIDKNSEEVKRLLNEGITHLNAKWDKNNKYRPIEVLSATSQVVAGSLTRIQTKIVETKCAKTDDKNLEDCEVTEGAIPKKCQVKVWEKPWENFKQYTVECEGEQKYKIEVKTDRKKREVHSFKRKREIPSLGGESEASQDDESVKKYLEASLAKLDQESSDKNKAKVHEFLSATKQVVAGFVYRIKAKIVQSDCEKNSNKERHLCGVLEGAEPKTCRFEVVEGLNNDRKIDIDCGSREKRQSSTHNDIKVRGGQTDIDKNSEEVKKLLNEGITHLNAKWDKNNKYKPIEVLSATSQVVAGSLTRIQTKIAETKCAKTDDKNLEDCEVTEGATPKKCEVKVWEKPWENFKQYTVECEGEQKYTTEVKTDRKKREVHSFKRKREIPSLGGESEASQDDESVKKYLEASLTKLDQESSDKNKAKVHEFLSATKQVVAGFIYRIKAKIVQSDCEKNSKKERHLCGVLEGSEPKTCRFEVFEGLNNDRKIDIDCGSRKKRQLYKEDLKVQFELFTDFIKKYNKKYSKKEFKRRFEVFKENLFRIRLLNTYEQGTATYGVTKFADLSQSEFSKRLGLRPDLRTVNETPFPEAKIPNIDLPVEFDWRKKGAVTEVKNQEQCGSCWAFSVTGNVEGQYALKHGKLLEFSEQELVDCDSEDQGCNGGLMDTAYRQIEKLGGLETEQDYPYDAEDEKCHFNRSLARVQLSGALNISHNESDMAKWLVANGPISIAINANAMQFYMGGVSHPFKFLCSPNNLDHGVLIVGYGVHTYPLFKKTLPYWIVKNSWGTSWGEQGYYRVYRGDGTCGLNQTPSSAIVV